MATFDYNIVYEDRTEIRTSRWVLEGVTTVDSGNTAKGWLWYSTVKTGDNVVVTVFKDVAGSSSVLLSSATDISGVDDTAANAVEITLAEANTSGMSGTMWIHNWVEDVTLVPVLVSLVMDADIEMEYARSEQSHMGNYDATAGYAVYCAAATKNTLLKVSHLYADELGGYGAPEARYSTSADRFYPDYRAISAPDQLNEAATYWAIIRIMAALDETREESMFASKAARYQEFYDTAVGSWNLTLNTYPDVDEDADQSSGAAFIRPERV